ncbi:hypothetical protein LTS18_011330, partial [Coniosporium uncinatum]
MTVTGLTGATQTVKIPFARFSVANADAITAFVWADFSSTSATWQMSKVQLTCGTASSQISTVRRSSTSLSTRVAVPSTSAATPSAAPAPSGACQDLLIDDWISQSRLTFLFYNAMLEPTSDDGTMASVIVGPEDNHVTFTPKGTDSYFYSQTGCTNAKNVYGGISLRIKAATGTTLQVTLSSASECGADSTAEVTQSASDLGWTFDGTEKLYTIPFTKFSALDVSKITTVFFGSFSGPMTFGPMGFHCGDSSHAVSAAPLTEPAVPSNTVPAPAGTATALVIDQFASQQSNALGFWHGADEGMGASWGDDRLTLTSYNPDYSFYTQLSRSCRDMSSFDTSYLHVAYSETNAFTIALQQHNAACKEEAAPYPETWDSLEAARYSSGSDIYIPMSHFNINRTRSVGFAFKGFYKSDPLTLTKVEIVPTVPSGIKIPAKLPSGQLLFACKRPNSFAFAIDDGSPEYAQEVLKIIKEEDIKVTFFTVGAPLLDSSTNLSNVYNEMLSAGHQIALHSYTHPNMEGLPDNAAIDWEY